MPNGKLHLGVSLVYPRAHVSSPSQRDELEDLVYIVFEPLIVPGGPKGIFDYYKHAHERAPGASAADKVFQEFEATWVTDPELEDPTPVSLPPGTKIEFSVADDTPQIPARVIGDDDRPFGVPLSNWPAVMDANGLNFRKFDRTDEDLWWPPGPPAGGRRVKPDEFAILIDWAVARLRNILGESQPPAAAAFPFNHELYSKLHAPYQAFELADFEKDSRAWWIAFLEADHGLGKASIVWMLDTAREYARTNEKERDRLSFPVFDYTTPEVSANLSYFFTEEFNSYAEIYWQMFRQKLSSWELDKPEQRLQFDQNVAELTRSLLLGERLFWPLPVGDSSQAAVIVSPGDAPEGFFGTGTDEWKWVSSLSLLGHCFGIKREDLEKIEVTGLKIGGSDVQGFGPASQLRFNDDLKRFAKEAATARLGNKLQLDIGTPATAVGSIGRIRFQPRLTTLDPDITVPADYKDRVLDVPTPVLDALEGRAEWDMQRADLSGSEAGASPTARYVRQTPQRAMVAVKKTGDAPSELLPVASQRDLFNAKGVLRLRARVSRVRLAGLDKILVNGDGSAAAQHLLRFELDRDVSGDDGVADSIHKDDIAEMKERAANPANARIWFGEDGDQKEGWFDDKVDIRHDENTFSFIASVPDGVTGSFKEFFDYFINAEVAAIGVNRSDLKEFFVSVELMFGHGETETPRVNAVVVDPDQRGKPHYVALSKFFDFTFLNTSENLYRRFYAYPLYHKNLDAPWASMTPKDSRIADTFTAAIKTFAFMEASSMTMPGYEQTERLTARDHLLPSTVKPDHLGENIIRRDSPPDFREGEFPERHYELIHSFKNPTEKSSSSSAQERYANENARFRFHALAGTKWQLKLRTDTRFGHSHFSVAPDKRTLPLFMPVSHPGPVSVPSEIDKGTPLSMLTYEFARSSEIGPEVVTLRFSSKYFQKILSGRPRPESVVERGETAIDPDMLGLRTIYETLFDLLTIPAFTDQEEYTSASLILELWAFNNKKRGSLNGIVGGDENLKFPSLLGSLSHLKSLVLDLKPEAGSNDDRLKMQTWIADLLKPTSSKPFEDFQRKLEQQFGAATKDLTFSFPVPGGDTPWTEQPSGSPYTGAPGDVINAVNVVRLGLQLRRHDDRSPTQNVEVKITDVYPTLLEREKGRGDGVPVDPIGVPRWMIRGKDGLADPPQESDKTEIDLVKKEAKRAATEILNGTDDQASEIRERFEWLRVNPSSRSDLQAMQEGQKDPKLPERLLGPAYPYTVAPAGLRNDDRSPETIKMFSSPVAFVQLAPIEPFLDRTSTNEYVRFLFDILQSLCDGEAPKKVGVKATDAPGDDRNRAVDELEKIQRDAIAERDAIAKHLVRPELLAIVEDDEDVPSANYEGELRRWKGYADAARNGQDNLAEQLELISEARKRREAIFDPKNSAVRGVIADMLKRNLRLYASAKAFAVHMLDNPDALPSERLYSCLITKYVRQRLWLAPSHVLKGKIIRDALNANLDPRVKALRRYCEAKFGDGFRSILTITNDEELKSALARLFNAIIDGGEDIMSALSDINWTERSLDLWRLDKVYAIWTDPEVTDRTIARRLTSRKNRLVISYIFDTAFPDNAPVLAPSDKIDADRFTFLDLNEAEVQGENHRFLVDVLEDADYDSEYEVAAHMTMARSGDDILESKNPYGELTSSDNDSLSDFGTDPGKRNLEVVLKPHNPEWRDWQFPRSIKEGGFDDEQAQRTVRWYYVLPSRRPPVAPVPLQVWDRFYGSDASERDTRSKSLSAIGEWRNRTQQIFPEAGALPRDDADDLEVMRTQYEENFDSWGDLDGENPVYLRDTPIADTGKPSALIVWSNDTTTKSLYGQRTAEYQQAIKKWRSLDSYIAHYHFEISPDEETTAENPLDGFRNDVFRVEIEEMDVGAEAERVRVTGGAETPPQDKLAGWYQYSRSLDRPNDEGTDREVVSPPKMTIKEIADDLKRELIKIRSTASIPVFPGEGISVQNTDAAKRARTIRLQLNGTQEDLKVQPTSQPDGGVGRPAYGELLDARILTIDDPGVVGVPRTVMRLSFLCSAVYHYRLRLKVQRNVRDVDRDGDSDMNRRFFLEGVASPWVNLGHYPIVRSPEIRGSLPEELLRLKADVNATITRQGWYDKPRGAPLTAGEFGDPLGEWLKAAPELWALLKSVRYGDEVAFKEHLLVSAVHLASRPDRTQSFDRETRDPIRDYYRPQAFAMSNMDSLPSLFNVEKADAPSVSKGFDIIFDYLAKPPEPGEIGAKLPIVVIRNLPFAWPYS